MIEVTVVECGATGYVPSTWSGNLLAISGTGDRAGNLGKFTNEITKAFAAFGDPIEKVEVNTLYGSFADGNAKEFAYVDGLIHEGALFSKKAITLIRG